MNDQWSGQQRQPTPDEVPTTSSTTQTAKDEAGNVASTAAQSGGQVADTARHEGQRVLSEAGGQARNLMEQTRSQVQEQAGTQQHRAAGSLRQLGDELGSMAGSSSQDGLATGLVREASERVQQVAGWLDSRDPQGLLRDVRSFARRRPGAFLLGAAVAGMVAGRATRSGVDAARAQQSQPSTTSPQGPGLRPEAAAVRAREGGAMGYPTQPETGSPEGSVPPTGYATPPGATPPVAPYPGEHRTDDDFVDPEEPRR